MCIESGWDRAKFPIAALIVPYVYKNNIMPSYELVFSVLALDLTKSIKERKVVHRNYSRHKQLMFYYYKSIVHRKKTLNFVFNAVSQMYISPRPCLVVQHRRALYTLEILIN